MHCKIGGFFTTLDKNLTMSFELNESQMGSIINSGTYNAVIKAGDGNTEICSEIKLLSLFWPNYFL